MSSGNENQEIPQILDTETRWRLALGELDEPSRQALSEELQGVGAALDTLYGSGDDDPGEPEEMGSHDPSRPTVVDALGQLRKFCHQRVYKIVQRDAIERVGLEKVLASPELTENLEPNVELVETILSLRNALTGKSLANARMLVARIVEQLLKRLQNPFQQTVRGALRQAELTNRPRLPDIHWHRTIRINLKNYQSDLGRIIPERVVGSQRRGHTLQHVILCVDQSASMAGSVIYSGLYASVMAQMPSLKTHLLLFDTAVADMTDKLEDPVELLFQVQLGGGTDIGGALRYAQGLVTEPAKTLLLLVTDLREGGSPEDFLRRAAQLQSAGVRVVVLLALSNEGTPSYEPGNAQRLAQLGIPSFGCTPEEFPELLAKAIRERR